MTLRNLAAAVPVIAALALAAPVASASAQTTVTVPNPAPSVPCFPLPFLCNAQGDQVGSLPYPYSFLATFFHQLYSSPGTAR